ncbi:MAG: uridine kinase [Nitrospinota bacterium]
MGAEKPLMIGIAGPSCAGKTALAEILARRLKDSGKKIGASLLSLDSYYRDLSHLEMTERKKNNFDSPDALDSGLLISHVRDLSKGVSIQKPVYRFDVHTREDETQTVKPENFVVVEGLFAFYWEELRKLFDVKVFVSAADETSFERRLRRDTIERGSARDYVIMQYGRDVKPMFDAHVLPTKVHADIEVNGAAPLEESVASVLSRIGEVSGR